MMSTTGYEPEIGATVTECLGIIQAKTDRYLHANASGDHPYLKATIEANLAKIGTLI